MNCPRTTCRHCCSVFAAPKSARCSCRGCAEDPDCKKWTEHLMAQERVTKICPPPKDEYKGDATFSCAADGWWMVCTNFIAALWLVAVVYTARRCALALVLHCCCHYGELLTIFVKHPSLAATPAYYSGPLMTSVDKWNRNTERCNCRHSKQPPEIWSMP